MGRAWKNMSCNTCDEARADPANYRWFADGCLHCAARHIQYIQRSLGLGPIETRDRCRQALALALELGLSELDIRRMAKLPEWQLAEPAAQAEAPATKKPKRGKNA